MKTANIAIMAHNEEHNILNLLERVSAEKPQNIDISGIIVISSASTDRTDEIVEAFSKKDSRVRLITQDKRYGKCAAINLFLQHCPDEALVCLLSGDILPEPGAVTRLLTPLLTPEVGMTGGRPVPINNPKRFFGFTAHLIWEIHHKIAMISPKLGEAVAFKKVMDHIPEDLAVDEAALEKLVLQQGLTLHYCPDAIIKNRGPDTLNDFLKQRRRIQAGHLHLKKKLKYEVSTYDITPGVKALLSSFRWDWRFLLFTPLACLLILYGRFLGSYDFHIRKKRHAVWDIAESTKSELSERLSK